VATKGGICQLFLLLASAVLTIVIAPMQNGTADNAIQAVEKKKLHLAATHHCFEKICHLPMAINSSEYLEI